MEKVKINLPKTRGINIFVLNIVFTFITATVFCLLVSLSFRLINRFAMVQSAINKFIVCENCSKEIKEYSEYLTEQARLFVVTQKTEYADAYIQEAVQNKKHTKIISEMSEICSEKDMALQRLQIALTQADSLIDMELYAIRLGYESLKKENGDSVKIPEEVKKIEIRDIDKKLSAEGLRFLAVKNLFSDGYLVYRTRINENCNKIILGISESIADDLKINAENLGNSLRVLRSHLIVLLLIVVLIFCSLAILVLYPLRKIQASIENDEKLQVMGSAEFRRLAYAYNEIYDMKAVNEKMLLFNAEYDALTGILNRRAFDHVCKSTAEKKQPIALLLVDMDNFKYINDTYGHTGGDTALKELAGLLMDTFRSGDYIARIGGDEFAAVLIDFTESFKNVIIEKINIINKKLENIKDGIKPVSISVGCAFSENGFSEQLYRNADKALYEVKENGRKGCRIFEQKKED